MNHFIKQKIFITLLLCCMFISGKYAMGQPSVVGQWDPVQNTSLDFSHTVQLKSERVLTLSHNGAQYMTFHPSNFSGTVQISSVPKFFMCGGHSTMADGKFFLCGGEDPTDDHNDAGYFDPDTETWHLLPSMTQHRWYPQTIILGDGRLLIYGGYNFSAERNENVEIYDPVANTFTALPGNIPWQHEESYLRIHSMMDGRIFQSSQINQSYWYTVGGGWTQGPVNAVSTRWYAPSVRLMSATEDRIILIGGASGVDGGSGSSNCQILNAAGTAWDTVASLNHARGFNQGILLPDGKVITIAGHSGTAKTTPELYDPVNNNWTVLPPHQGSSGTGDHLGMVLLYDGRVLYGSDQTTGGSGTNSFFQIYNPAYLYTGSRPTIDSVPADAGWGSSINVGYTSANGISSAVLLRPSGSTHSWHANQIGVPLTITNDTGSNLTLSVPANSNMLPPGYYMLFILDNNGAPSVSKFVRVSAAVADTTAPTPNPAQFSTVPFATGQTTIDMVADAGSDATPPIEYLFTRDGGAATSNWIQTPSWQDTGLSPGVQYCYTVQMRDSAGTPNVGGVSLQSCATTNLPNQNPPTPNPMTWASVPVVNTAGNPTSEITMQASLATDDQGGQVQYFFDETTSGTTFDSGWQTGTTYTATGLTPGTTYTFQVKARDPELNETGLSAPGSAKTDWVSATLTPYLDALPIPPIATPTSGTSGGVASYTITMQEVQAQVHSQLPATTLWGYDGMVPGPTIEASENNQVDVTWVNDLRDTSQTGSPLRLNHYLNVDTCTHGPNIYGTAPYTVVHLHGTHAQAQFDGYPEDIFYPGQSSIVHQYPNLQNDGTLWYHDHGLGITRLNVYMGLAGFYILRDPAHAALNLPSGEYEVPLMMMDRTFNVDGSLVYPDQWTPQFFGDKMLVNGKVWPFMNVKKGKYRFRMLNASGSRVLRLSLSNGHTFHQIGSDGGLLAAPVPMTQITLGNAERGDVVIDFSSFATGTEILLTNDAEAPFPGTPGVGAIPQVMKFIVTADTGHTAALPSTLDTLVPIPEASASITRELRLQQDTNASCSNNTIFTINGLMWNDITEQPILGDTEIWNFVNTTGMVHPMHMHLVMFQVLDRQAFSIVDNVIVPQGSPTTYDLNTTGFKDTVMVMPGEMVRVIATFTDYLGRFPYHCHVIEHEDHEMMRQFEVVPAPDTQAPTPDPATWAVNPAAHTDTSIVMTASTGTDNTAGVQYMFENITAGTNSGWVFDPVYYDFNLQPSTMYTYRVKMRDTSSNLNETAWSTTTPSATTLASDGNIEVNVGGTGINFTPADLQINVGETVEWVFQFPGHNVMAGLPGVHTGYFMSIPMGNPDVTNPVGHVFTHTFDQAFLSSSPGDAGAPNVYNYHCHPHGQSAGMVGTITVNGGITSTIKLAKGVVSNVSSTGWTTVNLPYTYTSMVVVATPSYDNTSAPGHVRIQNSTGSSFDVRLDGSAAAPSASDVYYMVVEEGVYTQASDGVTMEAVKYNSTLTDNNNSWVGETRAYANSYTSPVVLGQVMTYNDAGHVTFWSQGTARTNPPISSALKTGKTVNEDPDNSHANETIGYIVIEAGSGSLDGVGYVAAVGADIVAGVTNAPPYAYSLSGLTSASVGVVTLTAMDGNNGGWAVLYGASPVSASTLNLVIDEDQLGDTERSHTAEQVAYIVFEDAGGGGDTEAPSVPANLASPSQTQTTIDLTWTVSTDNVGVTGYDIRVDGGSPIGVGAVTSHTLTSLTASTSYAIDIRAKDAAGNNSAYSSVINVATDADATPPNPDPAVIQLIVVDSDTQITVTAQTGTDPSGPVEYSFVVTSSGSGGTNSGWQVSNPVHVDSGLTPGTEYCYTVQMRDSAGAQNTGTASAPSCVTTTGGGGGCTVPDVCGLTQAAAEAAITSAGLTFTTVTAANDMVLAGKVATVSPNAGDSVSCGSNVILTVSTGPTQSYSHTWVSGWGDLNIICCWGNSWYPDDGTNAGVFNPPFPGGELPVTGGNSLLINVPNTTGQVRIAGDAFGQTGVAVGETFWRLPNNATDATAESAPWMNISADESSAGQFVGGQVSINITSVTSPSGSGTCSVYSSPSTFINAFTEGVGQTVGPYFILTGEANGENYNHFAFSEPGLWTVQLTIGNRSGGGADFVTDLKFLVEANSCGTGSGGDTTPPSVPTSLASPSQTQTTIDLTWTASTDNVGVTGYDIRVDGGSPISVGAVTSHTLTGLTAGTSYAIDIRAKDAAGNNSAYSSAINVSTQSVPDTTPPSIPTNLASPSQTQTTIDLTWTASTDNVGVTGYDIRVDGGSPIGVGVVTSHTLTGLTASTSYLIDIRAKDAAGNNSAYSSTINVSTQSGGGGCDVIISDDFEAGNFGNWVDGGTDCVLHNGVNSPQGSYSVDLQDDTATSHTRTNNLNLSSYQNVQVDFSYNPISFEGSEDFFLEVSTNGGGSWIVLKQYVNDVDFVDTAGPQTDSVTSSGVSLTSTTQVRFRCDASGNGDDVYIDAITVSGCGSGGGGGDTTPPSVPTNLASPSQTQTTIDLTWTASTDNVGVTGYDIRVDGGSPIGVGAVTSHTLTGLTAGSSYSIEIRAKDAAGNNSAYSGAIVVSTQSGGGGTGPITITNFSFEQPGTGSEVTNWNNIPGWSLSPATDSGISSNDGGTNGTWTAFIANADGFVTQTTGHTISAGTYQVQIDAKESGTLQIELFYGSTTIGSQSFSVSSGFTTKTLNVTVNGGDPAIGQTLGVRFQNSASGETWTVVDNVRVTKTN